MKEKEKFEKKEVRESVVPIMMVKVRPASIVEASDPVAFLAYHNKLVEAINEAGFTIIKGVKKYDKLWKVLK